MTKPTIYETFGWVSNKAFIGRRITFDYEGQTFTATVRKDFTRGRGYCSFNMDGRQYKKCPLKLLSGLGLNKADKKRTVIYHPDRNLYAFTRDICAVSGNVIECDPYIRSDKCFYSEDARAAYEKAERISKKNRMDDKEGILVVELAREIYNSKGKDGNYKCHVSGVVMALRDLNSDHCHCTGKYMGLVTPEVNAMEGYLKKLLGLKGLEFTHEERLDLIRGMLQGAEKMHNKRLMKVWENTVTSKGLKKISTQQSTLMQLSLDL